MLTKLFYLLLRSTVRTTRSHRKKETINAYSAPYLRPPQATPSLPCLPVDATVFAPSASPPQPPLPLSLSPDVAQSVATSACCARLAQWCPNHAAQTPSGVATCPHRALRSSAQLCLAAPSTKSTARREIRWWWGLWRRLHGLRVEPTIPTATKGSPPAS
jgi:hypothetical protein